MNVSKIAPYAKTVVAVAGAVVVTATCLVDGVVDFDDATVIATAWGTVFGVFQVRNAKV